MNRHTISHSRDTQNAQHSTAQQAPRLIKERGLRRVQN